MKKTPEQNILQNINQAVQEAIADVLIFADSHGPGIELGIMGGYLNPTGGTGSMVLEDFRAVGPGGDVEPDPIEDARIEAELDAEFDAEDKEEEDAERLIRRMLRSGRL